MQMRTQIRQTKQDGVMLSICLNVYKLGTQKFKSEDNFSLLNIEFLVCKLHFLELQDQKILALKYNQCQMFARTNTEIDHVERKVPKCG